MLRPFTKIFIQQCPTEMWDKRNNAFDIGFVNESHIESGWEKHTDIASIKLPKNIVVKSKGFFFQQKGVFNVILGGSGYVGQGFNVDPSGNSNTNPPLLMKGDYITIYDGYRFKNGAFEECLVQSERFSGYISRVISEAPMELELEDNFYLLKRTPFTKTSYSGKLIDLCKEIINLVNSQFYENSRYNGKRLTGYEIDGTPIFDEGKIYPKLEFSTIADEMTANFSLGHLDIGTGMSCAQLLSRLKSSFHLDSFFVGNKLQFGFPIYNEDTAKNGAVFRFQNNIFSDGCNLEYKNKDDIILSAIVSCQLVKKTGRKTKGGLEATKKERESVLVYWDIPTESFKFISKKKGEPFGANEGGERHEFVYAITAGESITDEQLGNYGIEQLKKYYYTGFRGSFKTFGYPFVKWNDNIFILDSVFSDRNGQYKVKKVIYTDGVDGLAQEIFLDYRFNLPLPNFENTKKISMI